LGHLRQNRIQPTPAHPRRSFAWEFEKDGRELNVRVEGQLVFDESRKVLLAATAGAGLAFLVEDYAKPLIADGRLVRVLGDWCAPFPGYHLYDPSRRQLSPAFALLVEALRYRGRK
jgi:DNA-binding transcriptional LysR family regulator